MDPVSSGTGVFYQVMPAVGADGKNIMKLIPVQVVNGRFFKTRKDPKSQEAVTPKVALEPVQTVNTSTLRVSDPQRVVRIPTLSLVNGSPKQPSVTGGVSDLLSKNLPQSVTSTGQVPQVLTSSKTVKLPSQFPVAVKSTTLPRGPHLQISSTPPALPFSRPPSSAQSSKLPANSPARGPPTVRHMFPMTVDPAVSSPPRLTLHPPRRPSEASRTVTCGPTTSKSHLKLIPKASLRPNSPMKWVIEEECSSATPALNPLQSPSVTSEILRTVAERENTRRQSQTNPRQAADCSAVPVKGSQGQEEGPLMCSGKVFFVSKTDSLSGGVSRGSDSSPPKCSEMKETSALSNKHQRKEPELIPHESDEVIDLCDDDDDSQEDMPQTASMSSPDEDNVIFVSYIPPKPKSDSRENVTETAPSKQTTQTAVTNPDRVAVEKTCAGTEADSTTRVSSVSPDCDVSPDSTGLWSSCPIKRLIEKDKGSAAAALHLLPSSVTSEILRAVAQRENRKRCPLSSDEDGLRNTDCYPRTGTDGLQNTDRHPCTGTDGLHNTDHHPHNGTDSLQNMDRHPRTETDGLQNTDRHSRTGTDGLQNTDRHPRTGTDGLQNTDRHPRTGTDGLQNTDRHPRTGTDDLQNTDRHPCTGTETAAHDMQMSTCSSSCSLDDHVLSQIFGIVADVRIHLEKIHVNATATSHTSVHGPLRPLKYKDSCPEPDSSTGDNCPIVQGSYRTTLYDEDTEPVIGYMQPIDEDLACTGEDNRKQTCADANLNPHREGRTRGRTRKRPACPCCTSESLDLTAKASTKRGEANEQARMSELSRTRGGGGGVLTKSQRKDGRSWSRKRSEKTPGAVVSSSAPTNFDELKQLEEIQQLRDLLREKEEALEKMRSSMV